VRRTKKSCSQGGGERHRRRMQAAKRGTSDEVAMSLNSSLLTVPSMAVPTRLGAVATTI